MRRLLLVLAVLALLSAGCAPDAGPSSGSTGPGTPSAQRSRTGQEREPVDAAPDFEVTTFTGDRFSLGDHKGTPVVLNFWESW